MNEIKYSDAVWIKRKAHAKLVDYVAQIQGKLLQVEHQIVEMVLAEVRAAGLVEGMSVWQAQRDGKTVKRKVTALQVMFTDDIFWEVVVHMENPDNEFGALATLPNIHLRAGTYEFVPRPKAE